MDHLEKAKKIVDVFLKKRNYSGEDEYLFVEALNYVIDQTGDSDYVTALGGYYYGKKRFDLALMMIGFMESNMVPKSIFGLFERFLTLSAVAFVAVIGVWIFIKPGEE